MPSLRRLSCAGALALALASCVTVRTATRRDADLGQFKTFAWYVSPRPSELDRSPAGQVVRARIAADLGQKGIRQTRDHPDFLVAARQRLEERADVDDWGYPSVFWGAPPGPVTVDQYTQGTIIVDFIDPASGRVFWRGVATAVVDHPENPNLYKLAAAVDKVMGRYPSLQASATAPPRM